MIGTKKGFSAVELLIAMLVALTFLLAGYEAYQFIVKTSSATQSESLARNLAQDYLAKYKAAATYPCTPQTIANNQAVNNSALPGATFTVTISCQDIYSGGLNANYYNSMTPSGTPVFSRVESTINHNWGTNAPNSAVPADGFSVTWNGYVTPTKSGSYVFYGTSDDGEKLYVNGTLLIDSWIDQNSTRSSSSITLTAGQPVPISYSMYENAGGAAAILEWYDPDGQRSVIPASALSHKKTISKVSSTVQYGASNKKVQATTMVDSNGCQSGFIKVPGSKTYGTTDFCVMKYEAKIYGNDNGSQTYSQSNIPSSRASGTPYVNISQNDAVTQSKRTVDQSGNTITGAHLITEAEWMTIAQNVLQQPQNWSGGSVGSGFIYNGHNSNSPASALAADTNDSNGNYGETTYNNYNVNVNNKRTLALSNGEIMWDFSGNAIEWTSSQTAGNQPGATTDTSSYAWHEWNGVLQNGFPTGSMPSSMASGSLANIGSWTSAYGIGGTWTDYNDSSLHGFLRGGHWSSSYGSGVLYINLADAPSFSAAYIGFRVAYTLPTTSP